MHDKIFALTLLKQSPKCYKLLRKIFALPSRKTLVGLLKKTPFKPGLEQNILNKLKNDIGKMEPIDKVCMLMFDEMSLETGLYYNKTKDCIEGLEDDGENRGKYFANHVMVFMARGLATKWKQPLAYYFVKNGMKTSEIAKNIKTIIMELQKVELRVVGTVCDQYNAAAINMLIEESRSESLRNGVEYKSLGFFIENNEVIPIYDPPHLLKGIRNNLLKYNCEFSWKKPHQIASWEHIKQFYALDTGSYDTKMCNKLTDAHIFEEKMKKMKVKLAAQVFSQRVSSSMRALVKYGNDCLSAAAEDTADFLVFVDKVFDSLNGATLKPEEAKLLRCAVSDDTIHHKFYTEAIEVFRNLKFVRADGKVIRPPTINNCIKTLKGVQEIWKLCKSMGFKFLYPRNINQDPLENFFSMIRSHGVRNINPTCTSFISSFKALTINNFFSIQSRNANCEADGCSSALSCLTTFIENKTDIIEDTDNGSFKNKIIFSMQSNSFLDKQNAYIAGYLAKKTLKSIGSCECCKTELLSEKKEIFHEYILMRSYGSLFKPSSYFLFLYDHCSQIMHQTLPLNFNENNLRTRLFATFKEHITNIFSCDKHDLLSIFLRMFINFYIFNWVKNINKIIKGLVTNKINDPVKRQASEYYIKYRTKTLTINKRKFGH